ncbi:MAG: sigma-54 dependent transcriptional regulator [candidate division KSB1 bacterium]|nr:sigma-54 dependent transcriptional regulator [candidate division KSB1 bacterium]
MENFLLSKNHTMQDLIQRAKTVANSDAAVLLQGETGTGKNWLAKFIHFQSPRRNGLFQRIDCAEFSRSLIESELFGHEKGAFTGATQTKSGLLELVCGGTLFLDEIENLDHELQVKLLHVLGEKKFRRVGGREEMVTDFCPISATNADIEQLVASGAFRKDLYYRLNGVVLKLPPLRERPEDIPLFVDHFLKEFGKRYGRHLTISPEAMRCLQAFPWPGNIRELRMKLEAVIIFANTTRIGIEHLPLDIQQGELLATAEKEQWTAETLMKAYVQRVLRITGGNHARAAKILGWSLNTLKKRIQEGGLDKSLS